jgi:thiamine-monophosphate kinase
MAQPPEPGQTLGEFGRIQRFFAPLATATGALGLLDDAAVLALEPGERLVLTMDTIVEGVHFLPTDPADLVARKLLRVNLSDLAAMGAKPVGYLSSIALPRRCDDAWVGRFATGLAEDQAAFGISMLGGDSVSTPGPVTLTVTALGIVEAGREIRRSGARPGDLVLVSGTIGDGALGLMAANLSLPDLDEGHRAELVDRYRLPRPRLELGRTLAGLAHAMIDVSDGLVADLGHIADVSGVSAVIEAARIPLSAAAGSALALDVGLFERILTGGDDYEILFTAGPESLEEILALGRTLDVPVTLIGHIEAGSGVRVVDRDGARIELSRGGWQHE